MQSWPGDEVSLQVLSILFSGQFGKSADSKADLMSLRRRQREIGFCHS